MNRGGQACAGQPCPRGRGGHASFIKTNGRQPPAAHRLSILARRFARTRARDKAAGTSRCRITGRLPGKSSRNARAVPGISPPEPRHSPARTGPPQRPKNRQTCYFARKGALHPRVPPEEAPIPTRPLPQGGARLAQTLRQPCRFAARRALRRTQAIKE